LRKDTPKARYWAPRSGSSIGSGDGSAAADPDQLGRITYVEPINPAHQPIMERLQNAKCWKNCGISWPVRCRRGS